MNFLYKKYFFFSLLFFPFLGGAELNFNTSAKSAILINAESGNILFQKEAHERIHPASTTKIATALYVIKKKKDALHEFHTATWETVGAVSEKTKFQNNTHPPYRLEYGGTHMGIKVGERLSIRDLLYGHIIVSANDASNMLAQYTSGSIPRFMLELGEFLQEIGCRNTTFLNPHGLPYPGHLTSAFDLALMTKVALQDPLFAEIVAMKKMTRSETNKMPAQPLLSNNLLLRPGKYYYPHAIGVKTGTSKISGPNIVAAAKIGDRTLIGVLIGCKDGPARYQEMIELFNLALKEQKVSRTLFSAQSDVFPLQIKNARKGLQAAALGDIVIEYYPSEEKPFQASIQWRELSLPIHPQQVVGILEVKDCDGRLLSSSELIALAEVKPKWSVLQLLEMPSVKRVLLSIVLLVFVGLGIGVVLHKKLLSELLPKRKR